MKRKIDRRKFLKQSALASTVLPIALRGNCWDKELSSAPEDASITPRPLVLWYDKPASEWVEALPVGNGRLGAMVFGGSVNERLQLNEDTLYAGGPYDPNNTEALQSLPEARRLIFAGTPLPQIVAEFNRYNRAPQLVLAGEDASERVRHGRSPYQLRTRHRVELL